MFAVRKSRSLLALIMLSMTGSLLTAPTVSAATSYVEGTDSAAAMFDPLKVSNFSLQMSDADFESLRYPNVSWDNEGDWRETRMSFKMSGKSYGPYNVGVHLKGAWGSWRDVSGKAAFKIKMDAFVKDQSLFGQKLLTLNNMVQDSSYIHEVITYRLFRKLGIPSPRTGYANVTLNGINYGLHLNVETMNKQLLERWGITSNHLYKGAVPHFPDLYPGSEWAFAVESGSQTNYSDLTNFMAIQNLNGEQWWSEMSKVTNMELLTLGWASEIFAGHWDGYAINRNNYFINFDKSGQVSFLPWGVDQTWGGAIDYSGSPALLPNKCWAYEPCSETYRQSMAKVARVAKSLDLNNMASLVSSAIRNSISNDPFGPGIDSAANSQSYTQYQISEQQAILDSITRPWDTTLASMKINGKTYSPDQTIYLAPGTKKVQLAVQTSQPGAIARVQPTRTLAPGLNKVWVQVISENGQHINTSGISLYVYTNKVVKAVITYNKNTEVPTFAGIVAAGLLGTELATGKDVRVTIEMALPAKMSLAQAKVLLNKRTVQLVTSLTKNGIRPLQVKPAFTTGGKTDILKVSATYLK